jgi:hypothetical protein
MRYLQRFGGSKRFRFGPRAFSLGLSVPGRAELSNAPLFKNGHCYVFRSFGTSREGRGWGGLQGESAKCNPTCQRWGRDVTASAYSGMRAERRAQHNEPSVAQGGSSREKPGFRYCHDESQLPPECSPITPRSAPGSRSRGIWASTGTASREILGGSIEAVNFRNSPAAREHGSGSASCQTEGRFRRPQSARINQIDPAQSP